MNFHSTALHSTMPCSCFSQRACWTRVSLSLCLQRTFLRCDLTNSLTQLLLMLTLAWPLGLPVVCCSTRPLCCCCPPRLVVWGSTWVTQGDRCTVSNSCSSPSGSCVCPTLLSPSCQPSWMAASHSVHVQFLHAARLRCSPKLADASRTHTHKHTLLLLLQIIGANRLVLFDPGVICIYLLQG